MHCITRDSVLWGLTTRILGEGRSWACQGALWHVYNEGSAACQLSTVQVYENQSSFIMSITAPGSAGRQMTPSRAVGCSRRAAATCQYPRRQCLEGLAVWLRKVLHMRHRSGVKRCGRNFLSSCNKAATLTPAQVERHHLLAMAAVPEAC